MSFPARPPPYYRAASCCWEKKSFSASTISSMSVCLRVPHYCSRRQEFAFVVTIFNNVLQDWIFARCLVGHVQDLLALHCSVPKDFIYYRSNHFILCRPVLDFSSTVLNLTSIPNCTKYSHGRLSVPMMKSYWALFWIRYTSSTWMVKNLTLFEFENSVIIRNSTSASLSDVNSLTPPYV